MPSGEAAVRLLYQGQPLTASDPSRGVVTSGAGWIRLEAFRGLLRPAKLSEAQYAAECERKAGADAPEADAQEAEEGKAAGAHGAEGGNAADAALQHTRPRSRM